MGTMPYARQYKAKNNRSFVIKQDHVQQHPVDPVNPVKRNQSNSHHKNVRRTKNLRNLWRKNVKSQPRKVYKEADSEPVLLFTLQGGG
jgi:hypothetical protein